MSEYLVVIEHERDAWGAFCPDLPGLGVAGRSREEVERLVEEAIVLHIQALREAGEPVPAPAAVGTTRVRVPAA
jgi:predicted RNase H-like HicB family nuclease